MKATTIDVPAAVAPAEILAGVAPNEPGARRSLAHVGEEILEAVPAPADCDATLAVVPIG
jgi:hypothetical protein